jgi:hydrogenase/urease accessory protein HupE
MRVAQAAAACALAAFSQVAAAHGSVRGLGNFFSGVVHPLFEPAQLIALVALGLLIGQRGLASTQPAAACFAVGVALGLVATGIGGVPATDTVLLITAGLIGFVVLTAMPVPRQVTVVVASAVGLFIGAGSAPESVNGSARYVTLFGSGVGACVWLLNLVGLVQGAGRPWMRIGVRVAGSWVAACATLVIALWIAGTSRVPASLATTTDPRQGATLSNGSAPMPKDTTDLSVPLRVWR